MTLRIGLIARPEADRGLGIQSHGFFENMPVERVCLIVMPASHRHQQFTYAGVSVTKIAYNPNSPCLDETVMREWMRGLDVIFSVETPYDWQLPLWAKAEGVKTVIQGNPEFTRHDLPGFEHLQHPDAWWWPTSWRMDQLPEGTLMPVPMPDRPVTAADPLRPGPFRALHVVGVRAYEDRNGTDIVCIATQAVRSTMHLTIYGLDGELPNHRANPRVTVDKIPDGVGNRWEMYAGHHALVLPRRYAGLSLVALEAAACGLAVMMPDCTPNRELASHLIPVRRVRPLHLPCGNVEIAEVEPTDLAAEIDLLAGDRERLEAAQYNSWRGCPHWSYWRQRYLDELERVCAST